MVRCLLGMDFPDPKSPWRRVRVLCENFGVAPRPVGFRFGSLGPEVGRAPEKPPKAREDTPKDFCRRWLYVELPPGQRRPAHLIIDKAEALGFSRTGTLQLGKKELGHPLGPDGAARRVG